MHPKKIEFLKFLCELNPDDKRVDIEIEVLNTAEPDYAGEFAIEITLSAEQMQNLIDSGKIVRIGSSGRSIHYEVTES